MIPRTLPISGALLLVAGAACAATPSETKLSFDPGAQARAPHARMTRYPAVSAERIVFSYADDLWVIPRAGGLASPLASPAGLETHPRFSPDGRTVAFVGNYDGDVDLYTIGTDGGVPQRVTHHPQNEILDGWTPEGKLLFHANGMSGLGRQSKIFTVSPRGGLPEALPVPYGTYSAISPDGRWLAYSPSDRIGRTWKRYRGGLASDLWLIELATGASRRLTDFEGTDVLPMWHGETLYFVSDAGSNNRANLWSLDLASGERRQVTNFDDDVRWPSIGAGAIVFVVGRELRLLDLDSGASSVIDFQIPGAKPQMRPKTVDASKFINSGSWDISPSAKRLCVEARGDIWTLPAENGSPRNLTRSSGIAEREPAWSPDGRWIAYMSDESGEYELYVVQSDGKGEKRRVTTDGAPYRYSLNWSPDSKSMTLVVKGGYLKIVDIESGSVKDVDAHPLGQYPTTLGARWSHDSNWLVYNRSGDRSMNSSVYLYDVVAGESHQVTSDYFSQNVATFDREGKYLYFVGGGAFSPTYSQVDSTWVYRDTGVLHVVPLREDVGSPFELEIDEESWEEDEEEEGEDTDSEATDSEDGETSEDEGSDDDSAEGASDEEEDDADADSDDEEAEEEPLKIDLEGFERRAIRLPVPPGSFGGLSVAESGALLYSRASADGSSVTVQSFDVSADDPEESVVIAGVAGFALNAKGDKLLYAKGGKPYIADVSADAKGEEVSTSGMSVKIEPREEWAQILRDAWRLFRDFFYVPNMHGVDWDATYTRYAGMLEDATSRRDVAYLIGEMIAELNVGHAYSGGGDYQGGKNRNTGMLGADFELENGAYRIRQIYEGGQWDSDARGPLSQPGIDVKVGDYLLAVNGAELDTSKDPWAAFGGLAGELVTLTVSDSPTMDDESREVIVRPKSSERTERYREWIESKRRYVDERSGGKVAYVYVPDTGVNGQNDLVRQFYAQTEKQAMIIDDRWNGGGQIPTRFIELLNRPVVNYWARRDGMDWKFPYDAHHGPKCMLINGSAGSGGDAFPAYFKMNGLGKLIGMRTWGGLVGISGNPSLIDGAFLAVPTFGYYESDGSWGIEGHGVDPDIEVVDDPGQMLDGGDPQLDAAIDQMLEEIESNGFVPPARPAAPDRSGAGIPERDK